jgi:hypothetical protein
MPSSISTVVVLPAPLGPSKPKQQPVGIARSTPSTALTAVKVFNQMMGFQQGGHTVKVERKRIGSAESQKERRAFSSDKNRAPLLRPGINQMASSLVSTSLVIVLVFSSNFYLDFAALEDMTGVERWPAGNPVFAALQVIGQPGACRNQPADDDILL